MSVKLNKAGFDHAMEIIKNGLEVEHDSGNWNEVKPTRDEQVRYLDTHSDEEYGLWFLGIDEEKKSDDISKYVFPFGDFSVLHKSALVAAEQQSAHVPEIKQAAQKLLGMINQHQK